jgi:AcrR family transcriptional regulator
MVGIRVAGRSTSMRWIAALSLAIELQSVVAYETVSFRPLELAMAVARGRGEEREEAILRAALELLAEVGYDQMTMDAIATRAKASKATIYRRWSDKADLVVTAVRRHATRTDEAFPDAGSLRDDLLATLGVMRETLVSQDASLVLGLMMAMRRDPQLAGAVRAHLVDVKGAAFGTVIERAVARGELVASPAHGLLAEIGSAMLFSRLFVTGSPVDDAFVRSLVDDVLLPLLER